MAVPAFLRHVPWLGLLRALACVVAFLLVPLVVGVVNGAGKFASAAAPAGRPVSTGSLPTPTYDPTKRIAVIVTSSHGAEITDTLPTFEILSRSGAFNVYVVAPERTPLPLIASNEDGDTGLDYVPHFSFAGYDAAIGKAPDLIAIPYEGIDAANGKEPDIVAWVRAHNGPNTTLLGICVGSSILADTGLLDGHTATTNLGWLDRSSQAHPLVHFIQGVRYVDDGKVITSTNLASGVDATLHAIDKLVSRPTAEDVARQLGYTHTAYLDDPRFEAPPQENFPPGLVADEMFAWPQEQLGVLLANGVSEMDLAALLDPYTASFAAKPRIFAPERAPVVSRGGLVLLPRYSFSTVPALDRVVVPGGDATASRQQAIAAWEQRRPDRLVQDVDRDVGSGVSAYEASLRDLARSHDALVVGPIADGLLVPTDTLHLTDARWPIEPLGAPVLLGLLGVGFVLLVCRIRLPRRAHAPGHPAGQATARVART